MDIAKIPRSVGLVQILKDGSQKQIAEDEVIKFEEPVQHFKKAPRFKRG